MEGQPVADEQINGMAVLEFPSPGTYYIDWDAIMADIRGKNFAIDKQYVKIVDKKVQKAMGVNGRTD